MKSITFILLLISSIGFAQENKNSYLYNTIKTNDSLLFNVGFNTCDLSQFDKLLADDLEFYHDKGGISTSKNEFIEGIKNGICKSDEFVSRRVLVPGSLEVFPLYDNGKLYGAIQKGVHQFFEKSKGKPETSRSTAKFTHLWILKENGWKLSRALSYDHQMINNTNHQNILLSEETLKTFEGNYNAPKTGKVTISHVPNALQMNAGKMKMVIIPESETVFYSEEAPLTFEFVKNNSGKVIKILIRENGTIVEEAKKVSPE